MPEELHSSTAAGVVVGVDTHKDLRVAVAVDAIGRRLGEHAAGTDSAGLNDLQATRATVHEVCRPNRRVRRTRGKSDPIDAEAAARAVLAGLDLVDPKSVVAVSESLRQLRATRRSAVKARTQAANLVHALLLTAAPDLRASLDQPHLPDTVTLCARLRPCPTGTPREAAKRSLRCAARRWLHLNEEANELSQAMR